MAHDSSLILIGKFASPHGVKGAIKLRSYADYPDDILTYSPLWDKQQKRNFVLKLVHGKGADQMVVTVEGVNSRDEASKLSNQEIYVTRDILPEAEEDEFYYDDLIGFSAVAPDGQVIGEVIAMHNFGAGDIVDIRLADTGKDEMFPFREDVVTSVDVAARTLVMVLPETEVVAPSKDEEA